MWPGMLALYSLIQRSFPRRWRRRTRATPGTRRLRADGAARHPAASRRGVRRSDRRRDRTTHRARSLPRGRLHHASPARGEAPHLIEDVSPHRGTRRKTAAVRACRAARTPAAPGIARGSGPDVARPHPTAGGSQVIPRVEPPPPPPPPPPRLARRLLARSLPDDAREYVDGDLLEVYARHCAHHGVTRARLWYWTQAVSFSAQFLVERLRQPNVPAELESGGLRCRTMPSSLDVRLAARMLVKYPGLSVVSVTGMAVAIAIGTVVFSVLA